MFSKARYKVVDLFSIFPVLGYLPVRNHTHVPCMIFEGNLNLYLNIERKGKISHLKNTTKDLCKFTRTNSELSFVKYSISPSERELSHVDHSGDAKMVDVGRKETSHRVAMAASRVILGPTVFGLVLENRMKKGDVLAVAKIAGINAAKQTHLLIPLCHSIHLSSIQIDLSLNPELLAVDIKAIAKTNSQTGVEMEALVAASVSGLAIYDMCKGVSKDILIDYIRLEQKIGGKNGLYTRSK